MKKIIKRLTPKPVKSVLKRIYYLCLDTIDLFLGRREELTPPKGKISLIGGGDYKKIGEEFLQYLTELGDLKPNDRVLDVGCGIGRMAIPLTRYLNEKGRYEGFDIVDYGIDWCKKKITLRYPNFQFQLANIYNKTYNPKGKYKASEYKFPYNDESFDFIFLTSVFTHMLPKDVENYFSEIARVLRKEGRCLITFFLLNPESITLIDKNLSTLDFVYDIGGCLTIDKNEPESAVAYNERSLLSLYEKYGLNILGPIHYGSWCGRQSFLSYQDIIIGRKKL